jgi:hypothetical protein
VRAGTGWEVEVTGSEVKHRLRAAQTYRSQRCMPEVEDRMEERRCFIFIYGILVPCTIS